MDGTRKIDGCINCGEAREMAAHGLCFTCYRRDERDKERQLIGVDRHNPGIRREHKRIFRGFSGVMSGLSDLGVSATDVLVIRRVIDPYLDPIAKYLAAPSEQSEIEGVVNSEQKLGSSSQFTEEQELQGPNKEKGHDEGEHLESGPLATPKKLMVVTPGTQRPTKPKR